MQKIGDGSEYGVNITFIKQPSPDGLAHAVKISQDFIGDDRFVMFLGDNCIQGGISSLIRDFAGSAWNSQIVLKEVADPQMYGVADLNEDGSIRKLIEKPKVPPSNLALVGIYMFDHHVFEAVNEIKPSWRGEYEITDAIQNLIDRGLTVRPHIVEGWWKDTGKLEDMLEANRIILDSLEPRGDGTVTDSEIHGKVVVEPGARILQSTVRGPAIIGRGALIEHAYIGPFTSVGDGVTVRNSEVEHSILLEGSRITDVGGRIESSLIGKNVSIYRTQGKPRSFTFMLGDRSEVGLIS